MGRGDLRDTGASSAGEPMIDYATRDWLALVLRIRGTVIRRVAARSFVCALLAATTVYFKESRGIDLSIPVVVHSIIGVALGLLLVFRTNASYDRYWEGRRTIGDIVSQCRDLGRQTAAFMGKDAARVEQVGRFIVAYFVTVRRRLRHEREHPELVALLGEDEAAAVERASVPPLAVATRLSRLLVAAADDGHLNEQHLCKLNTNITQLIDLWSDAERIHETPVPFAYAHHIKLFLTLFCFTVPFALAQVAAVYAVVGSAVVALALFGIDEIGVEIEDPFGYDDNDLPLDAIGARLESDVLSVTASVSG